MANCQFSSIDPVDMTACLEYTSDITAHCCWRLLLAAGPATQLPDHKASIAQPTAACIHTMSDSPRPGSYSSIMLLTSTNTWLGIGQQLAPPITA